MPTGYTADVVDGKVVDFKTFALRCARNFGALIMMRDDSMDAPIPEEFKPSDFYAKELEKVDLETAKVTAMTVEECRAAAMEERKKLMDDHQKHVDESKAVRERLLAMRSQVADWTPPTPDHTGLKDFMVQQLDETMRHDGEAGTYYRDAAEAVPTNGSEWRKAKLQGLKERHLRYYIEVQKEIERTDSRNKWVAALRDSLR